MTIDDKLIPTPNEAKRRYDEHVHELINAGLQNVSMSIRGHNFDNGPLSIPFNSIIRPFPEISQFDSIKIIRGVLQRKGWFTKHRVSSRNEDFLVISAHPLTDVGES